MLGEDFLKRLECVITELFSAFSKYFIGQGHIGLHSDGSVCIHYTKPRNMAYNLNTSIARHQFYI